MARSVDLGRVLVVDDDASVRRVLAEILGREGHEVQVCARGSELLDAVASFDPDVVLLDLGLPDVGGMDLLGRLAGRVAVIVLSGRDSEADRVLALDRGADDYMVKPFGNLELLARVRARLRSAGGDDDELVAGDLQVDRRTREARLDGRPLDLTAKEFDLLHELARLPGRVRSRRELHHAVWGDDGGEESVTEHVHRLRRKIGDTRIATVRGVGYRLGAAPPSAEG